MKKKLYHCTHCYYTYLSDRPHRQCIDCGKFTVREATDFEAWEWVRYAVEEKAENLSEALAYVEKIAS